eukprot:SAG31_NODE_13109_length_892_cov_0.900378_1_plen_222_part_00
MGFRCVVGRPRQWLLDTDTVPREVRCGDRGDLENRFVLFAADEHGLKTEFEHAPRLRVEGERPVEFEHRQERRPQLLLEGERCHDDESGIRYYRFKLPTDVVMVGTAQKVSMKVLNVEGQPPLKPPMPTEVTLVAGEPEHMELSSDSVPFKTSGTEQDPETKQFKYTAAVQQRLDWPDLKAIVYDGWKNRVVHHGGSAHIKASGADLERSVKRSFTLVSSS